MPFEFEPLSAEDDALRPIVESLNRQLAVLAGVVNAVEAGHLDMVYVAPGKPRTGDVRLADGTNWNPGSGAGAYIYYAGAWNRLG
jgi:hypothetical protein